MLRGIKKLDFSFIWTMAAYTISSERLNEWAARRDKAQRRRIQHSAHPSR
jgi:hypothetical protein